MKQKRIKKELWGIAQIIALVMLIRFFIFEPYYIPSASMESSLQQGDFIFVWKGSYGYSKYSFSIPFANINLVNFSGRILSKDRPKQGDIAVFRYPQNTKINYVKRIIGTPNDTVQMKNGKLILNGEETKRQDLPHYKPFNIPISYPQYLETLPSGKSYPVVERQGDHARLDNTELYEVPETHYFAMGDNRDASQDSRYLNKVGYISEENIIGRPAFIMFSLDRSVPWWQLWHSINFDRIGTRL